MSSRLFDNRIEAGKALADRLGKLDAAQTVILALPRGGLPVAAEIAQKNDAPLDLLLVRKIGAPGNPELAIGAVVDGDEPEIVVNTHVAKMFGLSEDDVKGMAGDGLAEIERRRKAYLRGRAPFPVAGKTVIVVDDGIATGASIKAALRAVSRRKPKKVILAVPVAPQDVLNELRGEVDEIVCLETPFPFYAVGAHYRSFPQIDDQSVIATLDTANKAVAVTKEKQ